jgi:hypothetical protein
VGANDGTTVGVCRKPLGGPARRLALGNLTPSTSYWVDINLGPKDQLALAGTTRTAPPSSTICPLDSTPVRLTDFNAPLDALERGESETVTWSSDNVDLDGVVT